jgi:hypothetical protein
MPTIEMTVTSSNILSFLTPLRDDLRLMYLLAVKHNPNQAKLQVPIFDLELQDHRLFSEFIILANPATEQWQLMPYNPYKADQDVRLVAWSTAATVCLISSVGSLRCYRQEGECLLDWCRRAKRIDTAYSCRIVGCVDLNKGVPEYPSMRILDQKNLLDLMAASRLTKHRQRNKP